jgi:hypothetical protein
MKLFGILLAVLSLFFIWGAIANFLRFCAALVNKEKKEFDNMRFLFFVLFLVLALGSFTFIFENPELLQIEVVPNSQMIEKAKANTP